MGWLSATLTILGFIIRYGPDLWKIGVRVYQMVEEMKEEWRKASPDKPKTELEEMAKREFDVGVVRESARTLSSIPSSITRKQLRRDVWSTRKDNHKRIISGKTRRRRR